MATIIAGLFTEQDEVQAAVATLEAEGFDGDRISAFYNNPPGRHDATLGGGDHQVSPGAEDSAKGVAGGVAAGAAAGVAAMPFLGPVGPVVGGLVGGHVGSLVGSMSQMDEQHETPPMRRSGMVVALEVEPGDEGRAVDLLRRLGAVDIERAEGTIVEGDWEDFNPVSAPQLIDRIGPRHS